MINASALQVNWRCRFLASFIANVLATEALVVQVKSPHSALGHDSEIQKSTDQSFEMLSTSFPSDRGNITARKAAEKILGSVSVWSRTELAKV